MEKIFFGIIALIIGGLFLLLIFMGIDYVTGETLKKEVKVIERVYVPASTGVGVVNSTNSNGSGVIVTSESEKYTLVVDLNGEVFSKSVKPDVYARAQPDSYITLNFRYGGISGKRY